MSPIGAQMRVGDGALAETAIGPLINRAATDKVANLVAGALVGEARSLVGGSRHAAGENYFEPTVLGAVRPEVTIARAKIFGPVAPGIAFGDEAAIGAAIVPFGGTRESGLVRECALQRLHEYLETKYVLMGFSPDANDK